MSTPERPTSEPVVTGAPWLRRAPVVTTPPRPRSYRRIAKRIVITIIVLLLAFGGLLGWKFYQNASKLTGDKNPLDLLGILFPSPLQETNGRVNVLLAGYSADDPGHQGADLTDSIMILSINPKTKQAVVISVPRDLYVHIPGNGYGKINSAYEDGQRENFSASGYASGGMGLLEETVSQDFGVQFGYTGLLNYAAFRDAVNAVGGVKVTINSSDPRGVYDPYTNLRLPNGPQTLNGQQALNLARARGDGPGSYGFAAGDFDRTQHQQQMLLALKDKAASGGVLSNPFKIVNLADSVGNNVKTDMSLGEMATLYRKVKGIPDSHIQTVTLNNYQGTDYLQNYTMPDGEDALVPAAGYTDYSQIQALVSSLLGS